MKNAPKKQSRLTAARALSPKIEGVSHLGVYTLLTACKIGISRKFYQTLRLTLHPIRGLIESPTVQLTQ